MPKIDSRPYELAVLRGMFDRDHARKLVSLATAKHFQSEETIAMFKAFQRLHFAGTKVTPDLMRLEMVSRGDMTEEVAASVVDSIVMLPPPENLTYLVQGLGRIQAQNMLSELVDFLQTPEAIKNGMAGAVARINDFVVNNHQVSAKKPESLREAMARSLGRTEPAKVWTPGLGKLDEYWKIRKGSYTVIGGDSGSGKTALLVNMVLSIARQGSHVGVISIEMSTDELTYRAAAIEAGVWHSHIEDNEMGEVERQMVEATLLNNSELYEKIHVIDPAFIGAEELPGIYNELVTQYNCEVVFIDYIQRIKSRDKTVKSKMDEVSHASETITALTKATGVATVALSVLARDQGSSKKGLDHLKHSGQIGHDAHTVVIITPQPTDDIYRDEKQIVCEAVKNRKGRFFCEPLTLHGPTQRIYHSGYKMVRGEAKEDTPF
jgi:replicative DNA helicase